MSRDGKADPESRDARLEERRLESRLVFDGRLFQVFQDEVGLPDGSRAGREWIRHRGAVFILAHLKNSDELLFVRQYRYPVGRVLLELPAGKLDSGEDPEDCARRELEEETGFRAGALEWIQTLHPCVGYSDERLHFYFTDDLRRGEIRPDRGEFLERVTLDMPEVRRLLSEGSLWDAKTAFGVAWFLARRASRDTG